jgi:DNA polymerase-4
MNARSVLHLRFDLAPDHDDELLQRLQLLLESFTPRVQLIEPDTAVLELSGALRFWKRDARKITELVQLRALAYYGLRSSAGVGPNRMLAAMACALTMPGQRTVVGDSSGAIAAFLRPRPVRELPGVGAKTTSTLAEYGLHTVGDVADVPQLTLQRLLGARAGRALREHARGRDTTVVDAARPPVSISAEQCFARDELSPAAHRRALLMLADELGARLRDSDQITGGLTCTVHYADHSATRRTRTLTEATQHTVLLSRAAYAVYESFGLQRARVRSITLRAEALRPAAQGTRQLTLDSGDDKSLAIEAVADRARTRYGSQVLYPAALAISSRTPSESRPRGGQPGAPHRRRAK